MSLMGFDIGTSTCKGIVVAGDGTILAQHRIDYSGYIAIQASNAEIPAHIFWDSVVTVIRILAEKVDKTDPVEALSMSTHGETLISVDYNGNALGNAILSMDRRSVNEAKELEEKIGKERIYEITGTMIHSQFPIPKIMWIQRNMSELAKKVKRYYSISDYILHQMGIEGLIDYSLASRFCGFDIRTKDWSEEILNAACIDKRMLSKPVCAGTVAGELGGEIAKKLNLRNGVKVIVGGHDQACASIGMGITSQGELSVSAGSYECTALITDNPLNNEKAMLYGLNSYCHVLPGKYITLAFFVSGMMVKWYIDTFCQQEKEKAKKNGTNVYEYFDKQLDNDPTGICITPHIFGALNPEWCETATTKMSGITANATKADFYQAVLEGTCCELDLNIRVLEKLTNKIEMLCMSGGGTKCDKWMQMRSDITVKPIKVICDDVEASCLGAVILAGIGSKVFKDASIANEIIKLNYRKFFPINCETFSKQKSEYVMLHRMDLLD